jgi:hypothetical protein
MSSCSVGHPRQCRVRSSACSRRSRAGVVTARRTRSSRAQCWPREVRCRRWCTCARLPTSEIRPQAELPLMRTVPLTTRRQRSNSVWTNPLCQHRVSDARPNQATRVHRPTGEAAYNANRFVLGHLGRSLKPARQAGGHWFEPSTAHREKPWKQAFSFARTR